MFFNVNFVNIINSNNIFLNIESVRCKLFLDIYLCDTFVLLFMICYSGILNFYRYFIC